MKRFWILKVLILFVLFNLLNISSAFSQSMCPKDDPCKDKGDIYEKVSCYTDVVNICANQRQSMAAQIVYLSSKIELTISKIAAIKEKVNTLEKEIETISGKIDNLEESLTKISSLFIDRVVATYKHGETPYLNLIVGTSKFSDFINRYKYIQVIQAHDRRLLFQLQNSKFNFEEQKKIKEDKKKELSDLKKQLEKEEANLVNQKRDKEVFLEVTKNSEKIYKQNLEAAQREAGEIQKAASLLSKAGVPRRVGRGETIGVMGNTGFSTGPHLHFSVYNLKESELDKFSFDAGYENPFDYLSSREVVFHANSCDDVGAKTTKRVGSGSWEWPMSNPSITQCFGHTPFSSAYYRSGIHNGVDMFDDGNTLVKAVESGNAYTYRGGQSAGNGVFIFHDNGRMTLYWHLQ